MRARARTEPTVTSISTCLATLVVRWRVSPLPGLTDTFPSTREPGRLMIPITRFMIPITRSSVKRDRSALRPYAAMT